jgi:phage baseplate assembly protein W
MKTPDFLGRGWRFPIFPDARGALSYVEGAAHIEQSLKLVLMTALGERVMRPDFGSQAPDLVFAPGSVQYLRILEETVRDAVRDWEPRVELDSVNAESDQKDENHVLVRIDYKIRGTNNRNNLVFPFYVSASEGAP